MWVERPRSSRVGQSSAALWGDMFASVQHCWSFAIRVGEVFGVEDRELGFRIPD